MSEIEPVVGDLRVVVEPLARNRAFNYRWSLEVAQTGSWHSGVEWRSLDYGYSDFRFLAEWYGNKALRQYIREQKSGDTGPKVVAYVRKKAEDD